MSKEMTIEEKARKAKIASRAMARASSAQKNKFLDMLPKVLKTREQEILKANQEDLEQASKNGLDEVKIDRLRLAPAWFDQTQAACRELGATPDPIGATETQWQRPNGLLVGKMRIPLGVIAMIYESRPGVTVEAACLCLKAGNAVILRGGKEARTSCRALWVVMRDVLRDAGLPEDAVQLIDSPGHEAVEALCGLNQYIDVMIPRGGEDLIRLVCEKATMPVLKHYKGVCHAYIDSEVDEEMALDIVENSKTQRPGVCNALEGLLVNRAVAESFLPRLAQRLAGYKVEFRAEAEACQLLGEAARPLENSDQGREFLAMIMTVKIVNDMDEALEYIGAYGSGHTEIICTTNYNNAMRFLREADASMTAVNASTRFNDGGELGLGAEIGISTSKLHAYGPMGVKELTSTKFVVFGNGQVRV